MSSSYRYRYTRDLSFIILPTNIGPILDNIKKTNVSTESLITLDVDDIVTPVPISAYGKTLLDSTSLADLRTQILENTDQEAIRLLDDGNSEINFYTSGTVASNLRLQITDNVIQLRKPLYIEWPNKKFTIQGGATDNVIYEKSGLNLAYNISYIPDGEDETVTVPSYLTSKLLINNNGIALQVSDNVNTLPMDVFVATNTGINCSKNIIPSTTKQYDLGSANNMFSKIYCDQIICNSGFVNNNTITSDRRLKTNIVDLNQTFGLDFVNRMRPVSYKYKGKTRTHFGLIADDLYDLLQTDKYSIWSKLKDEQGTQTIQIQEFIGVFIKAIQELYGLLTNTDKKPIIIKEQVESVDHKCNCNSVELISQLNSYEIELLEKGEQLKVLDNQLEELTDDYLSLKKNSNIIIERLNKLELKNKELEKKINEKTNEIIDEDTNGGVIMIEQLQLRNLDHSE